MITLYNENDVQIKDIRIYEINDADMGESTITATVKFDQVIQFHPDWYLLLNGEKYKLGVTEPSGKRSTTRINVEYTLIFHSSREDLKRYTFMDFVEYGSGNPQPSQHTFSLQACTLRQMVNRFNINLQYYLGSLWTMELSDDADPNIVADLSFDKASLWDVLLELYNDYGVRWTIRSNEGYMTILIGKDATELQTIFEYGKGNGLISVERTNPTERIVTRLRGKGSEKNLPANYFHAATSAFPIADPDTNSILQGVFYNRLYPKCYRDYIRGYNSGKEDVEETWAYHQGVADKIAGKPMNIVDFAKSDNEALWGISYGAVEDNDEIYPTLQGTTRNGVELDKVLAVSPIYVDAPDDGAAARQFTQVNGEKGSFQGRDISIRINGKDGGISSVVGISNAKSATADSETFTLETAINTVRAKFLVTPTKFADHYANVVGVTNPESPILTTVVEMVANNWNFVERLQLINATTGAVVRTWSGNNQDFFDVEADDIPAGTYKFRSYIQWYKTTGTTQDKLLYTIDWQLYGCEYASYQNASSKKTFSETFDIWIGNVWNTSKQESESDEAYACRVWAPLVSKEEMTVMFSDGLLAGEDYEFPIVGLVNGSDNLAEIIKNAIHYDTSVTGSHWRLTLQKSDAEFEASGKYLPNSVINVLPGNHFFFINIQMPYDPYIYDAERRQQEYLEDQLSLLDVEQPTFAVVPSSVFMASLDEVDDVVPGNKIRLRDVSLIGSSYTTAYIQSISKRYTENKINPDWSLVVSDQILVGGNPITLIEGKVEVLSRQMYSSKQATRDAIEAFAQFYLRKDGIADASYSPTDFHAPITLRNKITDYNFRQGDFGGYGFGVYTDADGNRVVEADVLVGRMALRVNEIIVNQVEYVGGQKIYSAAAMIVSKVESTATIWRCYFDNKQGTVRNMFLAGDLAFCQRFKGIEEGGLTTYWAKVTAIGSDYIEISKTDTMVSGSGSPAVGDNIIQLGNASDQDRQSAIIMSSYGANSPSIRLYHGISGYTLANKDVFGVEYDSTNHIPYFYNYGSMRLGARETKADGQFITYNHLTGTLNIRATVNFIGGSSGLTNLAEWTTLNNRINNIKNIADTVSAALGKINDDTILSSVEKKSLRTQWEAINGLASTTETGTTGSYYMTKHDFDVIAWSGDPLVFIYQGVTYTYAQRAIVYQLVGLDDMDEAYLSLRSYLNTLELYEDTDTEDFDRDLLSAKFTAMYDGERRVLNAVASDTKTKADNAVSVADEAQDRMDSWIADGVISPLERIGIENEKKFIVSDYAEIVESANRLSISHTTLDSYYNAYVADLTTILSATPDENGNVSIPTNFATHQSNYYSERVTILDYIANQLKGAIDDAQDAANEAQDRMDSWIADGVISPLERIEIKDEKRFIVSDYDYCSKQAALYNLSYTALSTAYTVYLEDLNAILNATPDENGNVSVPADFASHSEAYYSARTTILAYVAAAVDDRYDDINNDIAQARNAADAAQDTADNAQDRMDGWLADGVLSKAELRDIKKENQFILSDYAENIYNAQKYNVSYTAYTTAYNTYHTDLANILSGTGTYAPDEDGNVTAPANFASHQSTYYTRRTALLESIYDAIKLLINTIQQETLDVKYLKDAFSATTALVSGGLYLGTFVGVSDNATAVAGNVVAGMNGSNVGADATHGKLMFFAGTPSFSYEDPDDTKQEALDKWNSWIIETTDPQTGVVTKRILASNLSSIENEKALLINDYQEVRSDAQSLSVTIPSNFATAFSSYSSAIKEIINTSIEGGYVIVTSDPRSYAETYYNRRASLVDAIMSYNIRIKSSTYRVYSDGHIEANDLTINHGKIGGFNILSDGIYYGDSTSADSLKMTTTGCYFPNTQIDGSIKTRLTSDGSQNFISLATKSGQPIVRINAMSLSTASVPTYLFLNNGTTILNTGASGWWSTLTISYWYNLLANVLPTTDGTLEIPSFKLYYNAAWVHKNFTLKVAVIKFSGDTEVNRYEYFTRTNLGGEELTLTVPALSNYSVDPFYSYGVYVFIGGALKNGMNNKSFIDVTTDNTTHALIRYTGDTEPTKGVFIGANGMNLTMGNYSKFLYIVPTVQFSSGDSYLDNRSVGGNFEVSLKASGNDSVGVRIVGEYDANHNLTSDGATIYLNLGKGGGWKKLSVESDGTLKLV